jgi:hypothetical protein
MWVKIIKDMHSAQYPKPEKAVPEQGYERNAGTLKKG